MVTHMDWKQKNPELTFAYCRVSAADQNPERQTSLFEGLPPDHVYVEHASGGTRRRPQLEIRMRVLRRGDTLVVKSPDRLARNTRDLLDIAHELSERGVDLTFVDCPELSVESATGEFMLTIYAGFAQLERSLIRERQAEGIALAKAKGKYRRAAALTPEQIEQARDRIALGVPKAKVAREMGVGRTTLYKALTHKGVYAEDA
jgi:DNA invertase Pin-like site-specific DNA recombinase